MIKQYLKLSLKPHKKTYQSKYVIYFSCLVKSNISKKNSYKMSALVSRRKNLTKEEKLARKQQLAEMKKVKKIEQEKQNLRNEFKRELNYTSQTRRILDQHWKDICGELTQKDLVDNLHCLRQNLNRKLDRKEEAIEQMRRWKEEAEVQYKRLFNGHLDIIEYLMSNEAILREKQY